MQPTQPQQETSIDCNGALQCSVTMDCGSPWASWTERSNRFCDLCSGLLASGLDGPKTKTHVCSQHLSRSFPVHHVPDDERKPDTAVPQELSSGDSDLDTWSRHDVELQHDLHLGCADATQHDSGVEPGVQSGKKKRAEA